MPVRSVKMGPGTLELGETLEALEVGAQVRAMRLKVTEQVQRTDPIPVLSGEELAAEESTSYEYTLEGTVLQDYTAEADGMGDYAWTHKGQRVAFRFTPSTETGRTVTGVTIPVPLDFGGDVSKTAALEAPVAWRVPEEPTGLGLATP